MVQFMLLSRQCKGQHNIKAGAREAFPRGLFQPEGSFRFSVDALLLGAFVRACRPRWDRFLDMGCGSGAVSFGLLLRSASGSGRALGIDIQEDLVRAARRNAVTLGLDKVFRAERADLADAEGWISRVLPGFDLLAANPPYRLAGQGRVSADPLRRQALFGTDATLGIFIRAAALAAAPGAIFCLVFPESRKEELLLALVRENFQPERLLPVQSRPQRPPFLILAAARKIDPPAPAGAPVTEQPLLLYAREKGPALTGQALEFCPYLGAG
ncbi:MAG: methyltransferase domain-containing protein [Desulfovibrionaceae bacterium]|nr:methyltransferase domain-containing protein [Desulfovibrionaceae bacterium]